ncbi:hypothetical protein BJ684DRAFT_16244, partial [Piptocephalis cylindrospora]
ETGEVEARVDRRGWELGREMPLYLNLPPQVKSVRAQLVLGEEIFMAGEEDRLPPWDGAVACLRRNLMVRIISKDPRPVEAIPASCEGVPGSLALHKAFLRWINRHSSPAFDRMLPSSLIIRLPVRQGLAKRMDTYPRTKSPGRNTAVELYSVMANSLDSSAGIMRARDSEGQSNAEDEEC